LAHVICRHLTIIHSSMNYCSCSFTYLIFVVNCITGSDENYASHLLGTFQIHLQPGDAVLHPVFLQKLCYKLLSVVTFTFIQTWSKFCLVYWMAPCWQAVWAVIFKIHVIFDVQFERQKVDKKSKPTRKLNISAKCHENRFL